MCICHCEHYSLHALLIHRKVAGMSVITVVSQAVTDVAIGCSGSWKEGAKNGQMPDRDGGEGDKGGRDGKYGG